MSRPLLTIPPRLAEVWLAVSGAAAFLFFHLAWLYWVPGLHYDESWAANFSARIATEPGFFPFEAMSPYTTAWAHDLTALLFHAMGISLFTYRLSGILMATLGVCLCSLALWKRDERRAAILLPACVACIPALVMNHRFVIEITSFHVLAFGTLFFGLSRARSALGAVCIVASILFGTTSHILFLAPAMALAATVLIESNGLVARRVRLLATTALLPLTAFFLKIYLHIPEKDKAGALLLVTMAILLAFWLPSPVLGPICRALSGRWCRLIGFVVFVPCFALVLFFAEGSWWATYFAGTLTLPILAGLTLIAPCLAFAFARGKIDRSWALWTVLTFIVCAAIAVKPAPRYFEIPLLMLAVTMARLLGKLSMRQSALVVSIGLLASSLQLGFNYFAPVLARGAEDRSFRFLVFRDGSEDVLSKQRLVSFLAESGCSPAQVQSADPRLAEELHFLAISDWKPSSQARCPWEPRFVVARKSQVNPASIAAENGAFVILK